MEATIYDYNGGKALVYGTDKETGDIVDITDQEYQMLEAKKNKEEVNNLQLFFKNKVREIKERDEIVDILPFERDLLILYAEEKVLAETIVDDINMQQEVLNQLKRVRDKIKIVSLGKDLI